MAHEVQASASGLFTGSSSFQGPDSNPAFSFKRAAPPHFKVQAPQNLGSPWMGSLLFLALQRLRLHTLVSGARWNPSSLTLPSSRLVEVMTMIGRQSRPRRAGSQRRGPLERPPRAGWGRGIAPRGSPPLPSLPLLLFSPFIALAVGRPRELARSPPRTPQLLVPGHGVRQEDFPRRRR